MRTVALIGGTGFLGRHLSPLLQERGWIVRTLSRRTGAGADTWTAASVAGCDAVVNLAGIKREGDGQSFRDVHVDLVARLLRTMREGGVKRLVHVSVVVARRDPALPYHDTKAEGEALVRESGLDWTILRPGVIYGAGDDLLSHLTLMLRTSPVFPIVNSGRAPMMPVHAVDVAAAVVAALERPASVGKTYEIVGPERMELRDVVTRVAEALRLPVTIVPTPVALMALPVRLMEATMAHPLSTRAQLAMLVEGLAGDPAPARAELGIEPAPFTPERLRPLLPASRPPIDFRLFCAPRPERELPTLPVVGVYALACALLALAFRGPLAPWSGIALAMGLLLALSLGFRAVWKRLLPTAAAVEIGLAAGAIHYGLTRGGIALLGELWPGWEPWARSLMAWKQGLPTFYLASSLVMIVVAEEALWRGVVARAAMERLGRAGGIVAGAALYALAHLVSGNPLLVAAAFGCGLYWGWLYAATDDLVAPCVAHLAWDGTILFVLPLLGEPT